MKLPGNLLAAMSFATLAACSGGNESATNNVADEAVLETENLDATINADTSLNGADLNALDANATDANASGNELDGAASANVTNTDQ